MGNIENHFKIPIHSFPCYSGKYPVAQTPRLPASGRPSTPGSLPRPRPTDTRRSCPPTRLGAPGSTHPPRPVPAEFLGRPGAWECLIRKNALRTSAQTPHRGVHSHSTRRAPATCDSPVESLPFRGEGGLFRRRPREISGRLPSILSCQLKKLNPRDGQQYVGDQAPSERQVWTGVPRPKFWVQDLLWLPSFLDICSGRLEANGESSRG